MKYKLFERLLTLVLVSCMLIQLFPMNLKAEQTDNSSEEPTAEQTQLDGIYLEETPAEELENPEQTEEQEPVVEEEPVEETEEIIEEEQVEESEETEEQIDESAEDSADADVAPTIVEDDETEEPLIEVVEDGVTYLFFGANYDKNDSALAGLLNRIEKDADYEAVDYVGLTGTFVMDSTDDVLSEVTGAHERLNSETVDLLTSSRSLTSSDEAKILNKTSGLLYEDEHVYVYGVTKDSINNGTTAYGEVIAFANSVKSIDETKTLIILAETEFHHTTGSNMAAIYWHDAINQVAEEYANRDVIVVYGAGSTMAVQTNSSYAPKEIKYSYVYAGDLASDRSSVLFGVSEEATAIVKYDMDQTEGAEVIAVIERVVPEYQTFEWFDLASQENIYVTTTAIEMLIEDVEVYDILPEELISAMSEYYAFDLDFVGYKAGDEISLEIPVYVTVPNANFAVHMIHRDGSISEISKYTFENHLLKLTVNETGIFVYGTKDVMIPENAVLVDFKVEREPKNQCYMSTLVGVSDLDLAGLVAVATFSDGEETVTKEIEWDRFETKSQGYYFSLSYDPTYIGKQQVILTYEYKGVVLTDSFPIWIHMGNYVDESNNIGFTFSDSGVVDVTIEDVSDNVLVARSIGSFVSNYVAYDITVKGFMKGNMATVTLPVPEGVENPVVYYVDEKTRAFENMNCVVSADRKSVTFETSHFSTYVIGNQEIDVTPGNAVIEGERINKTVWALVDAPEAGNTYIILNVKSGDGVAFGISNGNGSVTAPQVTVRPDDGIVGSEYIEIEDTSDLEWTVSAGLKLQNNGYWMARSQANLAAPYELSISSTEKNNDKWEYINDKKLVYSGNVYEYALTYNESWKLNVNKNMFDSDYPDGNVYFYKKKVLDYTPTTTYAIDIVEGNGTAPMVIPDTYDPIQLHVTYSTTPSGLQIPEGSPIWSVVAGDNVVSVDTTGLMTLTGSAGQAVIKVSKTVYGEEMTDFLIVDVTTPASLVLIDKDTKKEADDRIVIKGVTNETTRELSAAFFDKAGVEVFDVHYSNVVWASSNEAVATVDKDGVVSFTGNDGKTEITATYVNGFGETLRDRVTYSVTETTFVSPSDGTNDFPEYPNEGAIRFDKHAQAVGNFTDTGVVQVELSMTGVPYTTNNEIDVVIMLDMSDSMKETNVDRKTPAIEAAQEALKILVQNEDGSLNGNRVAIYGFNGWHDNSITSDTYNKTYIECVYEYAPTNETGSGKTNYNISQIAPMAEYNANSFSTTLSNIESKYTLDAGTNYAAALRQSYLTLQATKQNGRKQYLIFMTDGFASTGFRYVSGNGSAIYNTNQLGSNGLNGINNTYSLHTKEEYYSKLMKAAGVEIFTVGFQVGSGISSITNDQIEKGKTVLKKIAGTSAGNATTAEFADHAMFVEKNDKASDIVDIFKDIAQSIKQAATNVLVTDKISDEYTMIFDIPDKLKVSDFPTGQEFFIEVLEYKLEAKKDSKGNITDYVRKDDPDSLSKIYLKKDSSGNFYATDQLGNKMSNLVFEQVQTDTNEKIYGYWSVANSAADADVTVGNKHYKFMPMGDGTHNIKSGAYVSGNDNQNIKIITPYFIYDASTRILRWTSQKLSSTELALSYFLYLDNSAGWETHPDETDPGTYITNDYATIRYENHLGNMCEQEFPIPQMTWNGAQVSYVFYLVNDAGQPVNRAGVVVPFSEAVYVTDVFTKSVVWNDLEKTTSLESQLLAKDLLPDVYELFDNTAAYQIHVFEDENKMDLNNHFLIVGDTTLKANTTYVFNTKSDKDKFNVPGVYSAKSQILCKDYNVTVVLKTDSEGNVVLDNNGYPVVESYKYNGKASDQYKESGAPIYKSEKAADGTWKFYTIVYRTDVNLITGIDFANTTVAFAVKWQPKLAQDTVVIDYGLPVQINVTLNDNLAGGVKGVLAEAPGPSIKIDEGTYKKEGQFLNRVETSFGYATVENQNSVVYTLTDMTINTYDRFYYESTVSYNSNNESVETNMYSSVTVIPATSIYYEDSFVKFSGYAANGTDDAGASVYSDKSTIAWESVGTPVSNAMQETDRPGPDKIGPLYDADNVYGYDDAYKDCSTFSLGTAMKFTASLEQYGAASFEFYGTGFDVISLTSNETGTILVDIYDQNDSLVKTYIVDTYYGYSYTGGKWQATTGTQNALYQIPVISVEGLAYGKYKAVISVKYSPNFDHTDAGSYDFYLDAIRIFDPAGDKAVVDKKETIKNAYEKDGEYRPDYHELRNQILTASQFIALNNNVTPGVVFVDGVPSVNLTASSNSESNAPTYTIADYKNFGPNNELYLTGGQAISFDMNASLPAGLSSDLYDVRVQIGLKSPTGSASYQIYGVETNATEQAIANQRANAPASSLTTATEMYYDITDLNNKTVVIQATTGMLSITNIKITAVKKASSQTASVSHDVVNTAMIMPFMFGMITVDAEEELPLLTVNPVMTRKVLWALNGGRHVSMGDTTTDELKRPLGPEAPVDELVEVIEPTDQLVDPGDLPVIAEKRDEVVFEMLELEDFFEKFNVFDPQSDNIFARILSFIANCFAEFVLWLKQLLGF